MAHISMHCVAERGGIKDLAVVRLCRRGIGKGENPKTARIRRRRGLEGGEDLKTVTIWRHQGFGGIKDLVMARIWKQQRFGGARTQAVRKNAVTDKYTL